MKDLNKNLDKTSNIDNKTMFRSIASVLLISILATVGSNKYAMGKYNVDNIFNNKGLKISEEEAEQLFTILEEETGKDNLDNERDLVLLGAIDNPNLTDEEKETIFKLIDLIEEMPYIDKKMAYANLKELEVTYNNKIVNNNLGIYDYKGNKIIINLDFDEKDVLLHELIHSLFVNEDTYHIPKYFREGVTELLEDEYFSKEPYWESTSYPYEIAMVKILCDMVGSDTVLKAYATGDMKLIENELAIYMGKDKAKTYMKNVKDMFDYFETVNTTTMEYMSTFLEDTNEYFAKKYPFSNEAKESYEYNKELLIKLVYSDPGTEYGNYLQDYGYYIKPYFSKKLKEKDTKHYQKLFEGKLEIKSL